MMRFYDEIWRPQGAEKRSLGDDPPDKSAPTMGGGRLLIL